MTCIQIPGGVMCVQPEFKSGDPPPEGYLAWHEWAEVQHKAGLRQKRCERCRKFKFQQEMATAVCNECAEQ